MECHRIISPSWTVTSRLHGTLEAKLEQVEIFVLALAKKLSRAPFLAKALGFVWDNSSTNQLYNRLRIVAEHAQSDDNKYHLAARLGPNTNPRVVSTCGSKKYRNTNALYLSFFHLYSHLTLTCLRSVSAEIFAQLQQFEDFENSRSKN